MIPRKKTIHTITSTPKRRRLGTGRILRPNLQGFATENVETQNLRCSSPLDKNDDPPLPCNQIEFLYESGNTNSMSIEIPPSPESPDILEDSVMKNSAFWESPLVSRPISKPSIKNGTLHKFEDISNEIFQSKLRQEISLLNSLDTSDIENCRNKSKENICNINNNGSLCENSTSLLMSRYFKNNLDASQLAPSTETETKNYFINPTNLLPREIRENLQESFTKDESYSKIPDKNQIKNHNTPFLTLGCEKYFRDNEDSFNLENKSVKESNQNDSFNKSSLFETKDSFLLDIKESGIFVEEKQPNNQNVIANDHNHADHNERGFYGLPIVTKEFFKAYRNIDKFYDWQEECLSLPTIKQHRNLIYALPTSGGKTLVAEVLMMREVLNRRKNALFILPFVAIVQEKIYSLAPFAVKLNFLLEEYTGGKGVIPPKKRRTKNSIYIATIEKGLAVVRSLIELGRLDEIGLIVVDELHLIGEPGRGATLEILLTTVMFANKNIQIVGMSATIGNLPEVAAFLHAEVFQRDFRPVELTEYVKRGDSLYRLQWGAEGGLAVTFERQLVYDYSAAGSALDPDQLGGLVADANGPVLVFCPTKRNAENVAMLLCQLQRREMRSDGQAQRALSAALQEEGSAPSLCRCVAQGIAYHHAGLSNDERALLESAYKSGTVSVLCCTMTLCAGVNLPARRVIVRAPRVGNQPLTLAVYRQMAGRAGRAGHATDGECITICSDTEWPRLQSMLVAGVTAARSQLAPAVGALLAGGIALQLFHTRDHACQLLATTLLATTTHSSQEETKQVCEDSIRSLVQSGIVESGDNNNGCHDNETLRVTNLGRAAIKGCMDLPVAKQLACDLAIAGRSLVLLGPLHLLYLVTPTQPDIRPDYRHYYSLYCELDEEGIRTAKVLGITEMNAIRMVTGKPITNVSEQVLRRFYLALMLYDLWKQVPFPTVADKYGVPRGTVQSILSSSASFAHGAARYTEELGLWAWAALFTHLAPRLHTCAAPELAQLMELPSVKKARAMQLSRAGYKRVEDIAKASVDDLTAKVEHLSRANAAHLVSAARMMLIEKVENLRAEAEDVMEDLNM